MKHYLIAFTLLLIGSFAGPAIAADTVATLYSASGPVQIRSKGSREWRDATVGQELNAGETVHTGANTRAGILFANGSLVRLAANSMLELPAAEGQNASMPSGEAYFLSRETREFPAISTPVVSTAIRGTEFSIEVSADRTTVNLIDGAVEMQGKSGNLLLARGEQGVAERGKPLQKGFLVSPTASVQWAIDYPEVLSALPTEGLSKGAQKQIQEIQEALQGGDLERGFGTLQRAQTGAAPNVLAALHAQIAVVLIAQNDMRNARDYLARIPAAESSSVPVLLSSSYLAQAENDLPAAERFLEQALQRAPGNVTVRLRLAELALGRGDIEDANHQLDTVAQLAPSTERLPTLQGFVQLFEQRFSAAQGTFEQALSATPNDPLTHLGAGLARIAKGDLGSGRTHIEQAVVLDPARALYRSYLGKAFFEEDRETLALSEYARAIQIDPNDPTPYLYRAFTSLSLNAPVGALQDVERSIERNDHRAVYRSRMLLDRDLGVRSAGLAEVYNSLGFTELARVEAMKSLSYDYRNYSAHRLLADSYQTILLSDSKSSEQRIADLLAPLSFNLLSSSRSAEGANEYSALFDGVQRKTGVSASWRTNDDLLSADAFHSGRSEQLGYFFQATEAYGGGSRHNDFLRQHEFRLAGQYQPWTSDRFVLDTQANLLDTRADGSEEELDEYRIDAGYHKAIGPHTTFLAQAAYAKSRTDFRNLTLRDLLVNVIDFGELTQLDDVLVLDEAARDNIRSLRSSAQLLFSGSAFAGVLGAEYYTSDIARSEASEILQDDLEAFNDLGIVLDSRLTHDIDAHALYSYLTWHIDPKVHLTIGGSYNQVEEEQREVSPFVGETVNKERFNPKVGLTAQLTAATLLRASYVESLRKSSLEDRESLEPTFVGGINQRYADLSGAVSHAWSLGIDHKLWDGTYLGVEATRRGVTEDLFGADSSYLVNFDTGEDGFTAGIGELFQSHQKQDFIRGYLYQVLSDRWVGSLDYQWTRFERTDEELYSRTGTHRVAGGLRYFDPSGWFGYAVATFRSQEADESFELDNGTRNSLVTDAGIGYRLRHRQGRIVLQLENVWDRNVVFEQILGSDQPIAPELTAKILATFTF